ncbi:MULTISPECIES: late competence development ComFB family protein [Ureibacillus]|uniref:late competence development ComFB family protein n=1 Tax=Ureibacillus TaxID=160795 RepID=UPI000BBC9553|nr:late competence development ComFB family protein [Ureibacillus thermosphaericus]
MSQLRLVNVMEEIVSGLVRYFLRSVEYQTFCNCEECELNIVANVLNNLPTYYVVSLNAREEAFKELKDSRNIENINKEIIRAIHAVGKRSGHVE